MNFFRRRSLSAAALNLVEFDADSIRRLGSPDVWIADPDGYEKNGRVLRDSETPRMLAYSTNDHILYATDGSNACARNVDLARLEDYADLPVDLLAELRKLATKGT